MALHVIERQKDEFESRMVALQRVARVTEGGRRFSFKAIVVVGNRQGQVGLGVAKSIDISKAIEKATTQGRKGLIKLPIENNTIPYQVNVKYKAAVVNVRPAGGGGIIAGGVVRHICELGGIKNINVKTLSRSKNPINNARAIIKAFQIMSDMKRVRSAAGS